MIHMHGTDTKYTYPSKIFKQFKYQKKTNTFSKGMVIIFRLKEGRGRKSKDFGFVKIKFTWSSRKFLWYSYDNPPPPSFAFYQQSIFHIHPLYSVCDCWSPPSSPWKASPTEKLHMKTEALQIDSFLKKIFLWAFYPFEMMKIYLYFLIHDAWLRKLSYFCHRNHSAKRIPRWQIALGWGPQEQPL